MICFSFVRAFDARSYQWLIFLSRPIIYYTNKMNYSVYSKNRVRNVAFWQHPVVRVQKVGKTEFFFLDGSPIICCQFYSRLSNKSILCSSIHLLQPLCEIYSHNTQKLSKIVQIPPVFPREAHEFSQVLTRLVIFYSSLNRNTMMCCKSCESCQNLAEFVSFSRKNR